MKFSAKQPRGASTAALRNSSSFDGAFQNPFSRQLRSLLGHLQIAPRTGLGNDGAGKCDARRITLQNWLLVAYPSKYPDARGVGKALEKALRSRSIRIACGAPAGLPELSMFILAASGNRAKKSSRSFARFAFMLSAACMRCRADKPSIAGFPSTSSGGGSSCALRSYF
jgi:hypothetical protein